MKKYITRKEAAERLCCEPQTISNYLSAGLFSGMKRKSQDSSGRKNNTIVYVDLESFERFIENEYDIILELDDSVENYKRFIEKRKEALKNEREEVEKMIDELRCTLDYYFFVKSGLAKQSLIEIAYAMRDLSVISDREAAMFEMVADGLSLDAIGDNTNTTRERARQLLTKAIGSIKNLPNTIKDIIEQNNRLALKCKYRKEHIGELNGTINKLRKKLKKLNIVDDDTHMEYINNIVKMKNLRLLDLDLSIRAINCMHSAEVYTLYDLLKLKREDILHFRNLGRKTLVEIDEFVCNMNNTFPGISLGMFAE